MLLQCLQNWPINKATVTGELDDENLSILVTKSYIEQLGYLTPEGYWDLTGLKIDL